MASSKLVILIIGSYWIHLISTTNTNETYKMIHILLWITSEKTFYPTNLLGQKHFIVMNCEFQNCFLTDNSKYLTNITDFDAILFNARTLKSDSVLPYLRSEKQIYIFFSIESSYNYPISAKFDWFFNWTWTYKLNSDVPYLYLVVRDKHGKVIGPDVYVDWIDKSDMKPTSQNTINKLQTKNVAAAWFVSNCAARKFERIRFVTELQKELRKYNMKVDVFGGCGGVKDKNCSVALMDDCLKSVESDYYFYLAFENSLSEDYVTEKLLSALNHYAVPVVYGSATYSRFMPDGIYINALVLGPKKLAEEMYNIVENKLVYYDFFKWHSHYTYHPAEDSADTDPLCALCTKLNDDSKRSHNQVYAKISQWWNDDYLVDGDTKSNIIVSFDSANLMHKDQKIWVQQPPKSSFENNAQLLESVGDFLTDLYHQYFDAQEEQKK